MEFLRQFGVFWGHVWTSAQAFWKRVGDWNNSIHLSFHAKCPTLAKILGGFLRIFWGTSTHPAFAVLLALLLVGFVISGSITIIVSVSVFFAWLITVLWLARSEPVKRINILPRVALVLVFASGAAFAANWYVKWCLINYARNQPAPIQNLDGGQIKSIFDQEIKNLPIPSVASAEQPAPKQKMEKTPVVRITGLMIRPIEVGKPLILDVRYINDRNETVTMFGHYAQHWIEALPDEMDFAGTSQIENDLWASVAKAMRDLPRLKVDVLPKVEVQVSDEQNAIVMTDELIQKLDSTSGIYIAGEFADPSGRFGPAVYCVRVDKKRQGQQVSLCHSLTLPKQP
jgi:hypothetical protein